MSSGTYSDRLRIILCIVNDFGTFSADILQSLIKNKLFPDRELGATSLETVFSNIKNKRNNDSNKCHVVGLIKYFNLVDFKFDSTHYDAYT